VFWFMDLVDIVCFFVPTDMFINIVIIASVGSPQILLCVHALILLCLEHVFRASEDVREFEDVFRMNVIIIERI